MSFAGQSQYAVRFEWGLPGLRATGADAIVVLVDVLSFTTSVSVACGHGAIVFPCEWDEQRACELAAREQARVAARRGNERADRFTLSPESLLASTSDLRLVLPSQNGSVVAHEAMRASRRIVAASIRNAVAVGRWLSHQQAPVAVIAAGERWEDGTWRFAVEDLIGAGAVIANLQGDRSPEAASAAAAFDAARGDLLTTLRECSSGRELVKRGFDADVALAAELGVEEAVPLISGGAFQAITPPRSGSPTPPSPR